MTITAELAEHAEQEFSARSGHGQKLVVDDRQKSTRRKAVGRRHDVGFAPADELLADIDRDRAASQRRREPPDREPRAPARPTGEVEMPGTVDVIVRSRA